MWGTVYAVDSIETKVSFSKKIGARTLKITAMGRAATSGWKNGQLSVYHYIVPPKDGILDFNFYAEYPDNPKKPGADVITPIKSKPLTLPIPRWVVGVRVHAASNRLVEKLPRFIEKETAGEGMPLPWPFPYLAQAKTT